MDPSDYLLSPSDWHTKLLSYTDVVDRKLQQMTQQPHFRAARDWLHATIQNVSCAFTILFMLDQTQPCCGRRRFHIDTKDPLRGSSSPFSAFSRRGWIKPVYDPDRPDGRLIITASAYIPAVRVAGATATQNSPFSSLAVVVTIASTRCAYPRRDGQAELAWVAGYVMRQFTCPKAVTHPSTNRVQCSVDRDQRVTTTLNRHPVDTWFIHWHKQG